MLRRFCCMLLASLHVFTVQLLAHAAYVCAIHVRAKPEASYQIDAVARAPGNRRSRE